MLNAILAGVILVSAGLPADAVAQTNVMPAASTSGALRGALVNRAVPAITYNHGSLTPPHDPVGDGIVKGALVGAAAGVGLMTVMYATCNGSCDAPEPGPMYLSATAIGAGVGALTGWIIDGARRNTGRRFQVSTAVTPRQQSLRMALRF